MQRAPAEKQRGRGVPGPGTYKIRSSLSSKGAQMLFKKKAKSVEMIPGPGAYRVKSLFRKGSNISSKYLNDGTCVFT